MINDIEVEIKKNKNLTEIERDIINENRIKEFGSDAVKDFDRDYEPDTLWFFLRSNSEIVALGGLRPIRIKYLGEIYNILGICSTISIKKGKGFGKIMIHALIDYSKKTGKTLLGFTGKKEATFFKKAGLDIEKDFIKRFVYKNPKTGEELTDDSGEGIYYNGKDKFIKRILSNKSIVYIPIIHW